jgi:valyl-tRNA synthetase
MDKAYNHTAYEKKIYSLWEKSGAFTPKINKSKKPFTIIMPPPNANDPLHIGHSREVATQDILIRYHRMKGNPTLWLPGADHAGIETQYVFEKKLAKEGKSRFDFDRNTLYKMIWDYVQENKKTMENQLRQLGSSCDWSREKFTLDSDIVAVVYKTFKKLYDEGYVYRGERIVNYCPRCGTAYSQLEVEAQERDDALYFLNYGPISIATTRPETIFADVAVAVNPEDSRYEKLMGKTAKIPLINHEVPIISDDLVNKTFGTGALKITPGHDATDFAIGEKHHLSVISVLDENGKMINSPEKYIGMTATAAREEVVKDLKAAGKVEKVEKIHHVVGVCYRDHGIIEPMVSKQWFITVGDLAKKALSAIQKKEVQFTASKYEKIAKHWLKNLKDWNISRQIVWGIRIPAWRCEKCLEWTITDGPAPDQCSKCGNDKLVQDPDTFDTWFSSGQWPFATLMTTKPGDFEYFYPTSVMDPSYDILPFWVIRMLMLGLYRTGKVPFKIVLLHGLVRDKSGVKISKSKGNVIDPIEMAQKYGADALRMALIWGIKVENDNSLSEENIRGQRNFANKIWNMGRYIESVFADSYNIPFKAPKCSADEDQKILKDLAVTIKESTKSLEKYRLNEAIETIYEFAWHNFADKYIEETKERARRKDAINLYVLRHVYLTILKLLHPFAPFVTETVWEELKSLRKYPDELLISAVWPK